MATSIYPGSFNPINEITAAERGSLCVGLSSYLSYIRIDVCVIFQCQEWVGWSDKLKWLCGERESRVERVITLI